MRVFKFGGASVKDAAAVQNVVNVLQTNDFNEGVMVISAMAKTTNALEEVVNSYINGQDHLSKIAEIQAFHLSIAADLMPDYTEIQDEINHQTDELRFFLSKNKSPNFDYVYDQVICYGELLSTKIVSAYLNHCGIINEWLDVRDYVKTNSDYREAIVNWEKTTQKIQQLATGKLYVTQGFLGANENYFTTSLGREGSDYTGAIFSYALQADSLTIWKDVPGVLNADPRRFENAELLHQISYEETIELAYYGASVIHPKTLQPLQRKKIPLHVRSFLAPEAAGTCIKEGQTLLPEMPCYIVKKNQNVLRISPKDFSFIEEEIIRDVFHHLTDHHIKANLLQISAITLWVCVEDKYHQLAQLIEKLADKFEVKHVSNCSLFTIRHFTENVRTFIPENSQEVMRQINQQTLQIVVKE